MHNMIEIGNVQMAHCIGVTNLIVYPTLHHMTKVFSKYLLGYPETKTNLSKIYNKIYLHIQFNFVQNKVMIIS